ncbi:MAG: heparan-alpha-glucosaminide N-acetyltransferase [Methanofollis sp.]|uniref:heparan-alpha-glucosaminide N-acetyltransferase n=1 Tax=Methanofollis sp. TaxID=2052835 RepID=UPI0026273850|nr:heparan-alpha-glucosaminide N-acetyltransferase [Methanofollis sp.]MDD4254095.1 heparan-alpha-glucosaminide N-acetyltransferase [Methanofollis sp.]
MNVQPYAWRWGQILSTHSSSRRFREIDLLRGIAIVMMVVYHLLFDLAFFGIAEIDVLGGFWRYFALATATLFIALAGLSLPISYERRRQEMTGSSLWFEYGRRGGKVFFFGMLATLATWIFLGEGFIVFGILHLIGFAIITAPFFLRFGRWNFLAGAGVVLAAVPFSQIAGPSWLIPLGIHPAGFYSVDYVPIIPWLGVALIGMAIGFLLYPGGRRRFGVPEMEGRGGDALCVMGRNSLAIYLLHQPVIVAVLLVVRAVIG